MRAEPVPNNAFTCQIFDKFKCAAFACNGFNFVLSRTIRTLSRRHALSRSHHVTLVSTWRIFIQSETKRINNSEGVGKMKKEYVNHWRRLKLTTRGRSKAALNDKGTASVR